MAHLRPVLQGSHADAPRSAPRRRVPVTLAGCGDDRPGDDAVGDDPSATAGSPAATESTDGTEPSEAPVSETTEAVPTSEPAAAGLEARLLTEDEVSGANDETVWTVKATGPEDGATTGTCQRFDFGSLGANEALVRTFTSNQDTVEATQVVAEFADAKSAWRAHQVLK